MKATESATSRQILFHEVSLWDDEIAASRHDDELSAAELISIQHTGLRGCDKRNEQKSRKQGKRHETYIDEIEGKKTFTETGDAFKQVQHAHCAKSQTLKTPLDKGACRAYFGYSGMPEIRKGRVFGAGS